ncbi:serine/threonine protein kinase with PASTA sensor(s) [Candidatus Magnetoovum chiemensis]|nr:serine/threonine protein kinase with PASTA sensor(s) [Candidatus Magnetoovum chiemensis]
MNIITQCPECQSKYKIPSFQIGRYAKCSKCGSKFLMTELGGSVRFQKRKKNEESVPIEWKVGDVILDLYEVTKFLGEGGMGKVFKVHHREWNIDLAVKSPKPEELARAGGGESFQREAEMWVNLGLHPNIVSCYYVRELGGIPRVFAEYVDGGSLHDWIKEHKLLTLDRIIDVAIQFAWGLNYSHSKGLVHQDIKPSNVMMTKDGIAKVTDFGLARGSEPDDGETLKDSKIAHAGGMTPAFCSPEQANHRPLSLKTDIWSWAVSILVMFTGEVTWFSGTVAAESLEWYLQEGPMDRYYPLMPESITDLLRQCFKETPAQRPKDMMEIAERLKNIYKDITQADYPRQAFESSRATADTLNNRAVSLLDLGKQDEALKLWSEGLNNQPHHPESVFNRGLIQCPENVLKH